MLGCCFFCVELDALAHLDSGTASCCSCVCAEASLEYARVTAQESRPLCLSVQRALVSLAIPLSSNLLVVQVTHVTLFQTLAKFSSRCDQKCIDSCGFLILE